MFSGYFCTQCGSVQRQPASACPVCQSEMEFDDGAMLRAFLKRLIVALPNETLERLIAHNPVDKSLPKIIEKIDRLTVPVKARDVLVTYSDVFYWQFLNDILDSFSDTQLVSHAVEIGLFEKDPAAANEFYVTLIRSGVGSLADKSLITYEEDCPETGFVMEGYVKFVLPRDHLADHLN